MEAYCTVYSVRCGLYSSVEICMDDMISTWFSGECTVVDPDSAATCIDWLADLDCGVSGWIDACDQALDCN